MSTADYTVTEKPCTRCGEIKPLSEFGPAKLGRYGKNPACRKCACAASLDYSRKNKEKVAARKKAYREANKEKVVANEKAYKEKNKDALRARRIEIYHVRKGELREKKIEACRSYWELNADTINARRRALRAESPEHREKKKALSARWYEKNKEAISVAGKAKYAADPKSIIERVRAYEKANPEKVRLLGRIKTLRRRSRLREAGGYFSREDIERLYKLQRGKCANCGTSLKHGYHIDHRTPVAKGGDNSPANLELLCPTCNMKKSAKLPHEFAQENGRLI